MSDDLISRRVAIDALEKIDCSDGVGISSLKCDAVDDAVTAIKALPSAEPKTGRWKNVGMYIAECSECKVQLHELEYTNFCPNCGADMRGGGDE